MTTYYPNVTLCDEGCEMQGVDLNTLESKCQCKFNDLMNLGDNVILQKTVGEITDFISNSNIFVLKCYQDIFQKKYFSKNIGGFIFIAFIGLEGLFSILFFSVDVAKIFTYLYNLTESFINSIKNKNGHKNTNSNINTNLNTNGNFLTIRDNPPPRKVGKNNIVQLKRTKSSKINTSKFKIISADKSGEEYKRNLNAVNTQKNDKNLRKSRIKTSKTLNFKTNQEKGLSTEDEMKYFDFEEAIQDYSPNIKNEDNQNNIDINIDEFLEPDLDDMDYDDAIVYDKRPFCVYYWEHLKDKQMIINTFCNNEFLKPITMKLLLLILCFELYFVVNGLFYSEKYISELFHSTKEETFFSFFERSIEKIFYTAFVGVILEYIIGFFFIEEKKIKKLYLREKENFVKLKYEIFKIIKNIKTRFNCFIIFCFIISIFSWYYVNCFNNVYPGVKIEWIKSSITIILIMQLLPFITIFIETILRTLSFKCKSERLYELKKYLY
jgi:hypothetical protein